MTTKIPKITSKQKKRLAARFGAQASFRTSSNPILDKCLWNILGDLLKNPPHDRLVWQQWGLHSGSPGCYACTS